jgi:hypothetical protein
MSGINAGIYPLQDEINTTLELIEVNETLLDEIGTLEEQTESLIIITNSTLRPQALALETALSSLVSDNGIFINNDAGEYITDSANDVPAVATPSVLASIQLANTGIHLVSYNAVIKTNTADGVPTPLTSAFITWVQDGINLPDYTMTFYPNSAIADKQNFEIAISGVIPIQATQNASDLVFRVNVAPEDALLATEADNVVLSAILVSPYLP